MQAVFNQWYETLDSYQGDTTLLAKELVQRWRKNAPDFEPRGFWRETRDDHSWSFYLQLFLAGEPTRKLRNASNFVVKAFEQAYEHMQPGINNGVTWLQDILALRRAYLANAAHQKKATSLLLKAIGSIRDTYPEPTPGAYNYYYVFLSEIHWCIYTEIYEPGVVDTAGQMGIHPLQASAPSLFRPLEHARKECFRAKPSEASKLLKLGGTYQDVLDGLFYTLLQLNTFVIGTEHLSEDVRLAEFKAALKTAAENPLALKDPIRFLNLQRGMDSKWAHIGSLVSRQYRLLGAYVPMFTDLMEHIALLEQ